MFGFTKAAVAGHEKSNVRQYTTPGKNESINQRVKVDLEFRAYYWKG